jgi:hypothetical protein
MLCVECIVSIKLGEVEDKNIIRESRTLHANYWAKNAEVEHCYFQSPKS